MGVLNLTELSIFTGSFSGYVHSCSAYLDLSEQKARTTYDNILRFCDDPDVIDPIKFLRAREVVHFQRFGEALHYIQNRPKNKKFFMGKAE